MGVTTVHILATLLIALCVTASVTVLGIQGTLDASAVTGILGAVIGIAGGLAGAKVGGDISANGITSSSPPEPPKK